MRSFSEILEVRIVSELSYKIARVCSHLCPYTALSMRKTVLGIALHIARSGWNWIWRGVRISESLLVRLRNFHCQYSSAVTKKFHGSRLVLKSTMSFVWISENNRHKGNSDYDSHAQEVEHDIDKLPFVFGLARGRSWWIFHLHIVDIGIFTVRVDIGLRSEQEGITRWRMGRIHRS